MRTELSPRQRQVVLCAARGLTEKETARVLGISPDSVNVHVGLALLKLGARSMAHAVARAIQRGQIGVDEIDSTDLYFSSLPTPGPTELAA